MRSLGCSGDEASRVRFDRCGDHRWRVVCARPWPPVAEASSAIARRRRRSIADSDASPGCRRQRSTSFHRSEPMVTIPTLTRNASPARTLVPRAPSRLFSRTMALATGLGEPRRRGRARCRPRRSATTRGCRALVPRCRAPPTRVEHSPDGEQPDLAVAAVEPKGGGGGECNHDQEGSAAAATAGTRRTGERPTGC